MQGLLQDSVSKATMSTLRTGQVHVLQMILKDSGALLATPSSAPSLRWESIKRRRRFMRVSPPEVSRCFADSSLRSRAQYSHSGLRLNMRERSYPRFSRVLGKRQMKVITKCLNDYQ